MITMPEKYKKSFKKHKLSLLYNFFFESGLALNLENIM